MMVHDKADASGDLSTSARHAPLQEDVETAVLPRGWMSRVKEQCDYFKESIASLLFLEVTISNGTYGERN